MNLNPAGGNLPPNVPPNVPPNLPPNLPAIRPPNQPATSPSTSPRAVIPAGAAVSGQQEDGASSSRKRPGPPLQAAHRSLSFSSADPDRRDGNGLTALHRAIANGNRNMVRNVLRMHANPNLPLQNSITPLMLAVTLANRDAVEELLTARGLQRDTRDSRGRTALHYAAQTGGAAIIGLLLGAGIDGLAVRPDGISALHIAAHGGHAEAVAVLMDGTPGQWDKQADNGYAALHLAAVNGHANVIAVMAGRPGIDINQTTSFGYTALQLATVKGWVPVSAAILGVQGVDVNAGNVHSRTALQIAADLGYGDLVTLLVATAGIDVNKMPDGYSAPLHLAAKGGHTAVLQQLLAAPGIDVNLADHSGLTALVLCSAHAGLIPKVDAALMLLDHPDTDPGGAVLLLSSPRVVDYLRHKAGASPALSDLNFKLQELVRWTQWVPRHGSPNRFLTSMIHARLGDLLYSTRNDRPRPPDGARRDLGLKDGPFHLALALEQSLQFHDGYNKQAREYARRLLDMAPPEPGVVPPQPDHYHHQFLIGGIAYPRSEIDDMANARGNYALHGVMNHIVQEGWQANVHLPGFLLRGRAILMHLQARDIAHLTLADAVARIQDSIAASVNDASASERMETALSYIRSSQEDPTARLSDAGKLAMDNWVAAQPEPGRTAVAQVWRARLMSFGLAQILSQRGEVNEEGLTTTAPETLRLLQSYIRTQSHSGDPAQQSCAGQLQSAVLERLHDIGNEPRVCNTGCVQRLLDAPAGIDESLMAREPHDRAIFNEIMRIGGIVHLAFDDQFKEGEQGIVHESDQKNYDVLSDIVRKDILRATAIDDLVRRRGWRQSHVEAQLSKVLDAL
ncbi:ankyrin repeat domain-containing protein [Actimicrobium sp. CCC2.4]|uniref:ankyrin repeat domain-containing protein n=1 Tax=Actimicrobium sp. CCC2.4 TaxID=3048606 RepID=UPI002AC9A358|nr:ankyrin repeat domain-containing protein [Actimicrobium sp. CCC2.4]MEB0134318.1 ankyrin repeat domain-containing protein [Actimicrobium sp. CCC2.4]WPX32961.1 ankyrin repeat domain-containing protein [Actimicrobium sp. CCC2.4]